MTGQMTTLSATVSGNLAVVGASKKDYIGAANIYTIDDDGGLTEMATITAGDGYSGLRFGFSLALSGALLLVGTIGQSDPGAAYIFSINQANQTAAEMRKLIPSDGDRGDRFGYAVALSGTYALIGSRYAGSDNEGAAYVFSINETGMAATEVIKLTASDGGADDWLDFSVAMSENLAIAGAMNHATPQGTGAGSAYVFAIDAENQTAIEVVKLTAGDDGVANGRYGRAVALSGTVALISMHSTIFVYSIDMVSGTAALMRKLGGFASSPRVSSIALSGNLALAAGAPMTGVRLTLAPRRLSSTLMCPAVGIHG